MPPTTSSLSSEPSMVMFCPRPNWPADEIKTVSDFVGSKFGAGELPGISNANSRKLRPFSGRLSIALESMIPSTTDVFVCTMAAASETSTFCSVFATRTSAFKFVGCPTVR